ncbi:MAG: hypothetical protein ACPGUD_02745 [Parashewanella sp.]
MLVSSRSNTELQLTLNTNGRLDDNILKTVCYFAASLPNNYVYITDISFSLIHRRNFRMLFLGRQNLFRVQELSRYDVNDGYRETINSSLIESRLNELKRSIIEFNRHSTTI